MKRVDPAPIKQGILYVRKHIRKCYTFIFDRVIKLCIYKGLVSFCGGSQELLLIFTPKYKVNQIVYVDPADIKWHIFGKDVRFRKSIHGIFIKDGDWDKNKAPFTSTTVGAANAINELFVQKKPYYESEQFHKMKDHVLGIKEHRDHACRNLEEVHKYFDSLILAYETIRKKGYLTQKELGKKGDDEISIYIDRNGEFLNGPSGKHRLSIAKTLNLKKVPVIINGVHKQWAQFQIDKFNKDPVNALSEAFIALSKNSVEKA